MSRKLFGVGARGDLVGTMQRALITAGVPLPKVDEIYGHDTETAINKFQSNQGLAQTGVVDADTWSTLTGAAEPGIDEKALQLTAAFEGHGYTLAEGNFDGAWLTWGIVGFTLKHGEVGAIIQSIDGSSPDLIDQAFGGNAAELRQVVTASRDQQEAFANSVTVSGGGLAEPWKTAFRTFGNFQEVRAEQRRRAFADYFEPAKRTAAKFGITSELGLALAFDIHVQNGGIGDGTAAAIRAKLAGIPAPAESDIREAIANAVADHSLEAFREDVRTRKMAIATGSGTVHGRNYVLENWGLVEA